MYLCRMSARIQDDKFVYLPKTVIPEAYLISLSLEGTRRFSYFREIIFEWNTADFVSCKRPSVGGGNETYFIIFSDISERNDDYSGTIKFGRGSVQEAEVLTFFFLEVPDYKFAMLIYSHICINTRYWSQFSTFNQFSWNSHGWCKPYCFWKQSAQ